MPQINELSWIITGLSILFFFIMFMLISMNFSVLSLFYKFKMKYIKIYFFKIMI